MNGMDLKIEKYSEILHIFLPGFIVSKFACRSKKNQAWVVDSEKVFC